MNGGGIETNRPDDDGDAAQRHILVLCLDTSSSMEGAPIASLNDALSRWAADLHRDVRINSTIEIAIVTFGAGGVRAWRGRQVVEGGVAEAFVRSSEFQPPTLTARGTTPLTAAVELATSLAVARKDQLRAAGHQYYRPLICVITDGVPTDDQGTPTDDWQRLLPMLARAREERAFGLWALAVGPEGSEVGPVLAALAPGTSVMLAAFPFAATLQELSLSIVAVAGGADADLLDQRMHEQFKEQRT